MGGNRRQDLCARARVFASAVLDVYNVLAAEGPAPAYMTQQLFRAVSSIGANLEESQVANSRRDMAAKYALALREAREANEFVAMLTTSVRKLREPPTP